MAVACVFGQKSSSGQKVVASEAQKVNTDVTN